jgi:hypothetical protein
MTRRPRRVRMLPSNGIRLGRMSGAQRTTRQSTRVRTEQTAVPATAKAEAGWLLWCRTSIARHGCVGAFGIPGPWYTKLDLT